MADTQTSVEAVTPVASIEDRVANLLGPDDDAPPVESPAESTQDIQETDANELTPDDLPDEQQAEPTPQPLEALEITYNGNPEKLTKDRAVELAQKGLHLERATEKVMGELTAAQESARQIAKAAEQMQQAGPQLLQLQSQMAALQMIADSKGLNPQNMRRIAETDPALAQQMHFELQDLDNRYKQFQVAEAQLRQAIEHGRKEMDGRKLAIERQLLHKNLPQVRDQAKYQQTVQAMMPILQSVRPETVELVAMNAEVFAAFADQAAYKALQASKRASINKAQASPQPMKPGTPNAMDPKTRQSLDLRKEIKRATSSTDKARAIERFLETKF